MEEGLSINTGRGVKIGSKNELTLDIGSGLALLDAGPLRVNVDGSIFGYLADGALTLKDDYKKTLALKTDLDKKAGLGTATTAANGLMSAEDKKTLDAVKADHVTLGSYNALDARVKALEAQLGIE